MFYCVYYVNHHDLRTIDIFVKGGIFRTIWQRNKLHLVFVSQK